jgi:protein-disulfide isomerase
MNRRDSVTLSIALIAALAFGAWLRLVRLPGVEATNNATVAAVLADRSYPEAGPNDAGVTMVVFADYRCGICRASDPAMHRAVAADGKVRVIYRDWPIFGPPSQQAARLALAAAGQGIYPALHERLMQTQGVEQEAVVLAAVKAAGGDPIRLKADLAREREAIDGKLNQTGQDAFALGFRGTPSYIIGTRVVEGALSERQFRQAFAAARGG